MHVGEFYSDRWLTMAAGHGYYAKRPMMNADHSANEDCSPFKYDSGDCGPLLCVKEPMMPVGQRPLKASGVTLRGQWCLVVTFVGQAANDDCSPLV